jgi:hypothetical protein
MRSVFVAKDGTRVKSSAAFDTFWRFAAARQEIFLRRLSGSQPPWTKDPILRNHRFTNVYRASDRVSQFLIRHVIYSGDLSAREVLFRTLLFKLFNSIDTWRCLKASLGDVSSETFDIRRYAQVLDRRSAQGCTLYSAAYIIPPPPFPGERKHVKHLHLLKYMLTDGAAEKVAAASSLESVYKVLLGYPSLGPFLAFQFAIDLNYSPIVNFSEMDFVVAGPGARNGIRKCFPESKLLGAERIIRWVAESASEEFARRGIDFPGLWGRPLQLIDVQNLFCEVDKYARVAHPDIVGESNRTRIKQRFNQNSLPMGQWYPPKWKLRPWPVVANEVSSQPADNSTSEQGTLDLR